METSVQNSETQTTNNKRALRGYDLQGGVRIIGEPAVGISTHAVIAPMVLGVEKDDKGAKISLSPVLFTDGSIYFLNPDAVIAHYMVQNADVHAIYEKAISGGGVVNGDSNGSNDGSNDGGTSV